VNRAVAILAALVVVTLPLGRSHAGEPGALLQRQVDRIVSVFEGQGRDGAARRQAVRAIVDETFDFREAAHRTLGHAWTERTPEEQAHFVNLFVDLIDRAYLRRLDQWDGQRIVVNGDAIDDDQATVRAEMVSRDGSRTPTDFLMRRSPEGQWRIVDINVDGTSLLSSYRVQFARLLQTGGFAYLMERLQAKVSSLQP
jgi:phospholipid transport system substrate-binding protein